MMNNLRILVTVICIILATAAVFAYSLSEFPAPFVQSNGVAAPNLAIIVGDDAAASDVFGAIDVALALQAAASKFSPLQDAIEISASGESISMMRNTHILGVNDFIGNLREALTEVDLGMLKGGTIVTSQAATRYNQYLRFQNSTGQIIFDIDNNGRVSDYLSFESGDQLFEWQLEFERGLISEIKDGELKDLEDKDINVLGQLMVIADTDFTESSGRLVLKLMGGAVSAILGENDKQSYKVGDKSYLVEVLALSTTTNNGEGSVKFRINGELTQELSKGQVTPLSDGTYFGVRNILPSQKETQKSLVQLYLGAYYILLEDRNINDKYNTTAGAIVNGKIVTTSTVQMNGAVIVANKTIALNSIHYYLAAEPISGQINIKSGESLSQHMKTPEGMLVPTWDIHYNGLSQTGETIVQFKPVSESKYKFDFSNQEKIYYDLALLTAKNNCLRYGDETNDLWFIESNLPTTYYGTIGDFFALSKCDPATNKNNCNAHILKYRSADSSSMSSGLLKIYFTDLGTGNKDITLTLQGSSYQGEIQTGDGSFAVYANPTQNVDGNVNISIDLNGDGAFTNAKAIIGTRGKLLVDLGATNTNESNEEGRDAYVCTNPTITLRTLSKEFDKAQGDEIITLTIESRAGNTIGMQTPITATSGYFSGLKYIKHNKQAGLSGFGIFFDFYSPGERAETLTLHYPLEQRGADVLVGAQTEQPAQDISTQTQETMQLIQEPTAKNMLSATTKTQLGNIVKFTSEIDDIKNYNSILIGGACVNPIVAELQGNPQPCWQSIAPGIGLVYTYEFSNGNIAMIVAGRSAADTKRATAALANKMLKNIQTTQARITSTADKKIKVVGV